MRISPEVRAALDEGRAVHRTEAMPAQMLLAVPLDAIGFRIGEDPFERLLGASGLLLVPHLGDVQQAQEHQVGDLLDHRQGIGDTARVEFEPQAIDLAAKCSGNHGCPA